MELLALFYTFSVIIFTTDMVLCSPSSQVTLQNLKEEMRKEYKAYVQQELAKRDVTIANLRNEQDGYLTELQSLRSLIENERVINQQQNDQILDMNKTSTAVVESCAELSRYGIYNTDTYTIDPDGEGINGSPIEVTCDIENDRYMM